MLELDPRLKTVITGTGRCGTTFVSRLLSMIDIRCGHEQVFTQNTNQLANASKWVADASVYAMPFLNDLSEDIKIIHLVRHPVDCIASFLRMGYFAGGRAFTQIVAWWARHCPQAFDQPNEDSVAVAYWTYWNKMMIERGVRHNIEDDPTKLLGLLNVNHDGPLFSDTLCNHRDGDGSGKQLEQDNVDPSLWDEMVELAQEYNYVV